MNCFLPGEIPADCEHGDFSPDLRCRKCGMSFSSSEGNPVYTVSPLPPTSPHKPDFVPLALTCLLFGGVAAGLVVAFRFVLVILVP